MLCFSNLDKPPYLIKGTLPQRLAKIRHIHLHFKESSAHRSNTECKSSWAPNRQCSRCSFSHWLEAITDSMTGLRSAEISLLVPGYGCSVPTLTDAWVVRLLTLQQRSKATLMIRTVPPDQSIYRRLSDEGLRQIGAFDLQLKKKLAQLREVKDAIIDIPEVLASS